MSEEEFQSMMDNLATDMSRADLKQYWMSFDCDRDNKLSSPEFWRAVHGFRECGSMSYKHSDFHKRFDWNGDGRMNFEEFTQAYNYVDGQATDPKIRAGFEMMDCN